MGGASAVDAAASERPETRTGVFVVGVSLLAFGVGLAIGLSAALLPSPVGGGGARSRPTVPHTHRTTPHAKSIDDVPCQGVFGDFVVVYPFVCSHGQPRMLLAFDDEQVPVPLHRLPDLSLLISSEPSVPTQIGHVTALQYLVAQYPANDASVEGLSSLPVLPSQLGLLTDLEFVDVEGYPTSRAIPTQLNQLTKLTHLALESDSLVGTVPPLSALTKLTDLDLSHNALHGDFPDLSRLTNLRSVTVRGNQFSGAVPWDVITRLPHLDTLDVQDNQLEGTVPWAQFPWLNVLCDNSGLSDEACAGGSEGEYLSPLTRGLYTVLVVLEVFVVGLFFWQLS